MNNGVKGRIHSVESFGAVDGPGIRYVVFVQGCQLRCLYCHNPDSWKINGGKEVSSTAIVDDILTCRQFYRSGGVTISGGEPLLQSEFTADILRRCRENGLHTAIDTSGAVPIEKTRIALEQAELLLLDIKTENDALSKRLTGKDFSLTKSTLDYCEENKKPVWIRHVIVPEVTLDMRLISSLADFIKKYSCVEETELLPFHKMGEYKWKNLGIAYSLEKTRVPTKEEMNECKKIFIAKGLNISVK